MMIETIVMNAHQMAQIHPHRLQHLEDLSYEKYYKFLFYLMKGLEPGIAVELGVYKGYGLAHMAAACSCRSQVIGVDKEQCDWNGALSPYKERIQLFQMDSIQFLRRYDGRPIGLLHIDTIHEPGHVDKELQAALPKMCRGGVICVDDIFIDEKMRRWWFGLGLNKLPFPDLHSTGYGVIVCNGPA